MTAIGRRTRELLAIGIGIHPLPELVRDREEKGFAPGYRATTNRLLRTAEVPREEEYLFALPIVFVLVSSREINGWPPPRLAARAFRHSLARK